MKKEPKNITQLSIEINFKPMPTPRAHHFADANSAKPFKKPVFNPNMAPEAQTSSTT
ncbi:hypothetical protein ACIDE9_07120 [Methylophilus sp. 'Pure River']|uniref:hypothetical protein n=1 Tax=Methylophilus sp. 'Pure River' TaxID=3377117 RepID=UPI00398F3413